MMKQALLPLAFKSSYGKEDFIIASQNKYAIETLAKFPKLPFSKIFLIGESGSGKTHICHIFQEQSQGLYITPKRCPPLMETESYQTVIVDQLEQWQSPEQQEYLFHLYNQFQEKKGVFLLAGQKEIKESMLTLPDLVSRLHTCHIIEISPCVDDAFLTALLAKNLSDRGLYLTQEIADFLWSRIERSPKSLMTILGQIDCYLLSHRNRKLSYSTLRDIIN